jgi:hypothetical protein
MTGFHHLPDEELDEKVKEFILNHGCTTGQCYVGGYLKSVGLRIQRKRIRESMARVDPHNTALRYCYFSQAISSSLAKSPMAPGWPSFFD